MRDERCEQTGWAFTGYYDQGRGSKRHEVRVPIGVFSTYALGVCSANAWMKTATSPVRWEGEKIYEACDE
jgi:hypothetical protein